ncbi:hypothetical protein BDA99DRAFT_543453 [Phascolomyces articulosus]|uniref:Uncharacterized protein n=1 Tax=Phascolomyces articulosus TaxID=60185 RepID=A0AAD5JMG7_9FUNG|nr:hypothetical protein BDA99DRAFT_543453 [Phascolomyces articulosus]
MSSISASPSPFHKHTRFTVIPNDTKVIKSDHTKLSVVLENIGNRFFENRPWDKALLEEFAHELEKFANDISRYVRRIFRVGKAVSWQSSPKEGRDLFSSRYGGSQCWWRSFSHFFTLNSGTMTTSNPTTPNNFNQDLPQQGTTPSNTVETVPTVPMGRLSLKEMEVDNPDQDKNKQRNAIKTLQKLRTVINDKEKEYQDIVDQGFLKLNMYRILVLRHIFDNLNDDLADMF